MTGNHTFTTVPNDHGEYSVVWNVKGKPEIKTESFPNESEALHAMADLIALAEDDHPPVIKSISIPSTITTNP